MIDPQRWIQAVEPNENIGASGWRRPIEAARKRAVGELSSSSAAWSHLPVHDRAKWWTDRISNVGAIAAATPRAAGMLSDRIPATALLDAAAAGMAVCAVAHEYAVGSTEECAQLLATVIFKRTLSVDIARRQRELEDNAPNEDEMDFEQSPETGPSTSLNRVRVATYSLWRLARTLQGVQGLLDDRPRGGFAARSSGKLPVVGVAGGWFEERGAIQKVAEEAEKILLGRATVET